MPQHAPGRKFRTKRLVLRSLDEKDIPDLVALLSDWTLVQHLAFIPWPFGVADAKKFLTENPTGNGIGTFAILRVEDNRLLGVTGIEDLRHGPELSYWLGRNYWNQGYATEAISALLRYAFEEKNIPFIFALVAPENKSSKRVLQKLGFRHCGDEKPSPKNIRPPKIYEKKILEK